MFDPGFWEIVVIGVLGLLILGPERLPVVAKKVGYWVGKGRRYLSSVRSDIEREFRTDELEKMLSQQSSEIEELKSLISDTAKQATDVVQETQQLVEANPDAEAKENTADKPSAKKTPKSKANPSKQASKTSEVKAGDDKDQVAGKD